MGVGLPLPRRRVNAATGDVECEVRYVHTFSMAFERALLRGGENKQAPQPARAAIPPPVAVAVAGSSRAAARCASGAALAHARLLLFRGVLPSALLFQQRRVTCAPFVSLRSTLAVSQLALRGYDMSVRVRLPPRFAHWCSQALSCSHCGAVPNSPVCLRALSSRLRSGRTV